MNRSTPSLRHQPAPECDDGPDGFNQSEWPCTLQKAVERSQHARDGESQDEPRTSILEGIADEHGRNREQPEQGESVHSAYQIR